MGVWGGACTRLSRRAIRPRALQGQRKGSELERCVIASPRTPAFWSENVRVAWEIRDSVSSFKSGDDAGRTAPSTVRWMSQRRKAWERVLPEP